MASLFDSITGGLGALGTILSPITQSITNKRAAATARENTDKTIRANKELAQFAYNKDVEMWERANKYNSPTAQMTRLKDAGLNPHLVYGSGTVAGNTSTSTPKYNTPDVEYKYKSRDVPDVDLRTLGSYIQDATLKKAQIANLRQQNDNLSAQADKTRQDTVNASIDAVQRIINSKSSALDYKVKSQLQKYNVEAGILGVEKARKEIEKIGSEVDLNKIKSRLSSAQITQVNQAIKNLRQDYDINKFEYELNKIGVNKQDNLLFRLLARQLMGDGSHESFYFRDDSNSVPLIPAP